MTRKEAAEGLRVTRDCLQQLHQYFSGTRQRFELPIAFSGTPFQRLVWKALRRIPLGQTRTYGDIANMIGQPRAARAVGRALSANPVCLLLPCHRVVPAGGGIGGYAGGRKVKKWLLEHETKK